MSIAAEGLTEANLYLRNAQMQTSLAGGMKTHCPKWDSVFSMDDRIVILYAIRMCKIPGWQ